MIFRRVLLAFLLITFHFSFAIPGHTRAPLFTQEELRWIETHPRVTLGADYSWPPFDFQDTNGSHSGISADYIAYIEKVTGLEIAVRTGVWSEILEDVKNGTLDGLTCAVRTSKRAEYLLFSRPYLSVPTVIVTRKDNNEIQDIHDLYGKTVIIGEGTYLHDWLEEYHPKISLTFTPSNTEALESVAYGKVDAYIENLAATSYVMNTQLLTNLQIAGQLTSIYTETSVAIVKDKPILMGIIQKALDSMPKATSQRILSNWFLVSSDIGLDLTDSEKEYIRNSTEITVTGAPAWPPFSYKDGDTFSGMIPDYFSRIEKETGLTFRSVVPEDWSSTFTLLEKKQAQLINGITESQKRSELMDFTRTYMKVDIVLATQDTTHYIPSLDHLSRRKLGITRDYITAEYVTRDFPDIDVILYTDDAAGLLALAKGEIYAFAIDAPSFEHFIKENSLINLKISGLTPYSYTLSIGVEKDNEQLLSILNKAIRKIPKRDIYEIYNNWVTIDEPMVDYSLVWRLSAAALVIVLLFAYWNRRLSREVDLRKKAENEALEASRAKSDFLANMSHEIRTPINSVLGFAELLDNMVTDAEQKSYLKSIRQGGTALLNIINDILDLSKIEAGKMVLKPMPLAMHTLMSEMEDFFAKRMSQKNLVFHATLPETFPHYIFIDGTRLRQILINLIGNALKFTEEGYVSVGAEILDNNTEEESISFTLYVSDSGIGIAPEQQEKIFGKFEQQRDHDHSRYGGTGLGLAISHSLAQLMGSSISLTSTVGEGSTFTLTFTDIPVIYKVDYNDSERSAAHIQFDPAAVLVVDDIEDNRKLLSGMFRDTAVTVHEASNGREAIAKIRAIDFDLVFMDLRMPVMNGYEAISLLRNNDEYSSVPVIAFTASVMGEDMEKVQQYGFDGYIRKPTTMNEVFTVASDFISHTLHEEGEKDTVDVPLSGYSEESLRAFLDASDNELLKKWEHVRNRGDFTLTANFADALIAAAETTGFGYITEYGLRLRQNIETFDIIEVDSLMKEFPLLIEALRKELDSRENSNGQDV